jgi:hypothetical protein
VGRLVLAFQFPLFLAATSKIHCPAELVLDSEIEVLSVQNPDGSAVIMLANQALNAPTDNNGHGAPRTNGVAFLTQMRRTKPNSLGIVCASAQAYVVINGLHGLATPDKTPAIQKTPSSSRRDP